MRTGEPATCSEELLRPIKGRAFLAAALALTMIVSGVILAQRASKRTVSQQSKPVEATITPASFDSPSKEYIYAGGRLIATEEPPPTQGVFQGYHDGAGCNTISGWAWDPNNPSAAVSVDVFDGATLVLQAMPATMYREDLLNVIASPNHGFSIPTPASLKNGASHSISVKFSGTTTILPGGPKTIQCSQSPAFQGSLEGAACNTIAGWAWDSNDPGGIVNVDVYNGATFLGSIAATQYRQDLAGPLGSPYHGFTFPTPSSLKDGQPHTITVKFGGTSTNLTWGNPKTLNCSSGTPNFQGVHDPGDCNMITGYALDTNDPGGTVNVAIYDGNNYLAVVSAQQLYPGIGYHGFSFAVPASLKNGQPHSIFLKFSGINTPPLQQTPRTITCSP